MDGMKLKRLSFLIHGLFAALLFLGGTGSANADTIKVAGKEYENAELFEIGSKGAFYKVENEVLVVPWAELDRFAAAAIRQRFAEALVNLHRKAYWVKGTVFEKNEAGIVIHTGSSSADEDGGDEKTTRKQRDEKAAEEKTERQMSKEGTAVFKNGAEVATGLVVLKDLPRTQYDEGADVETLAYKIGNVPFEMGLGMKKNLMVCNIAKPEWVGVRKWKNSQDKIMEAELIALKDGKCLFQKAGKNFVYQLDQLSDDDQKLVADFQENSREIPLKAE